MLFRSVRTRDWGILPVGGVIFFDGDVLSQKQLAEDVARYRAESSVPLWIGADEEGGTVSRLSGVALENIGAAKSFDGDAGRVRDAYGYLGEKMAAFGFNVNFAPVADVLTNAGNTVIGSRSFGTDPDTVAACALAAAAGLEEHAVTAIFKHFPGHGDTAGDSHDGRVSLLHDRARLDAVEFLPFHEAVAQGARAVLAGHISLPALTGGDTPATLSPELIDGLLRGEWGFDGVVFTDALDMRAITKYYGPGEASVMALQAGCDVLLMPENLVDAHAGVLDAVLNGILSEERLDESLLRQFSIKWTR